MKNLFKGFYNPSPESLVNAWGDENTIFVFDTNVLLNLYSYAEQTRDDFFKVLESLANRIWVPYHVGLEYQKKRLEIIRNEKAVFRNIQKILSKFDSIFIKDLKALDLEKRFPKLHENTERFQKEITKSVSSYKRSVSYWDEKQPCVRSHDFIREKINYLFDSKVGEPPSNQEWLDSLYKEGEKRYENKIPPGFEDDKKSNSDEPNFYYDDMKYERKYGDLIIWKQIVEMAKSERVKNVILVTDDRNRQRCQACKMVS